MLVLTESLNPFVKHHPDVTPTNLQTAPEGTIGRSISSPGRGQLPIAIGSSPSAHALNESLDDPAPIPDQSALPHTPEQAGFPHFSPPSPARRARRGWSAWLEPMEVQDPEQKKGREGCCVVL